MTTSRGGSLGLRLVVGGLLATSLLPLANWIPSERSAPWYRATAVGWVLALAGIVVAATLLAMASRRLPGLWREGALSSALGRLDPGDTRALVAVSVAALVAYLLVAGFVFERRPLLIDEVAQLFQARTYAQGRLWLPVDPDPAFRSTLNLVEFQGRWFSHFPPGWPLLLAIGELVGAPWIVGPVVGALTVVAWGLVLRRVDSRPSIRAGALLLFGFAPFTLFMAASHMNHGPVLFWLLAALAGWLAVIEKPSVVRAGLVGVALGMAAITRPADAAAFAVPAAIWAVLWARRNRRFGILAAVVVGGLGPLGFMLVVNAATTGSPFLSGYGLLWGPNVGLGFHPAPYGPAHTPLRGLELVSLYLLRLNVYLFEAPVPGLLAAGLALLLARELSPIDRVLLGAGGLLLVCYFAYWHDGFFLGPRFVYPLAPLIALWTARLPRLLEARWGPGVVHRVGGFALGLTVLGALATGIPARLGANSAALPAMRVDPDRLAAEAGAANAVILVRESWGAQLLARLWALGASKPDAERYYRTIDSCVLDGALAMAEAPNPGSLAERLAPLMADSGRLVRSPFSPDTSERVLNGTSYSRGCIARINEDRQGVSLLAPLLLSRRKDLWFGRDLHGRNARILEARPEASVYLLRQPRGTASPELIKLSRDSVLRAE